MKRRNKKLATKTELKAEQDEIVKLQTYDLSLFIGQSYLVKHGAQLYLILQPLYYTLKRLGDTTNVVSWKSKGKSTEKLTTSTTTDNSLSPPVKWYRDSNLCLVFKGSCLKQKNTTFTPRNNFFVAVFNELDTWSRDLNSDFTL